MTDNVRHLLETVLDIHMHHVVVPLLPCPAEDANAATVAPDFACEAVAADGDVAKVPYSAL
jgi:hypothetical protein